MVDFELIIIGAGPTGLFATFAAGLRNIKSLTLEALDSAGGQLVELYPEKMVYDMPGIPKIRADSLSQQMYEQAIMFKNEIRFNSKVTDIKQLPDKTFQVEVNGKEYITCQAVLICSGVGSFVPNKLGVEGEDEYDGKGVFHYVKSISRFSGQDVVIVGAGDSGFDWANELAPVANSITILQHNDVIKAEERSVKEALDSKKVNIRLNTSIIRMLGDGQKLTSVEIQGKDGKETLKADSVILAISYKIEPNSFKSITLATSGRYIKVNHAYETSISGIFAAGDIANVTDEPKFNLLAIGSAEAYIAINNIKKYLHPTSSLFGGHSSSLNL
ncbi:MAG: NAD(P)/FAD-dependent oxidoreductase [Candidatus Parvarchaeota archaeon]